MTSDIRRPSTSTGDWSHVDDETEEEQGCAEDKKPQAALGKIVGDFEDAFSNVALSVPTVGKRDRLRHPLIRNYDPPKMPLYAPVAGQFVFLNPLGT